MCEKLDVGQKVYCASVKIILLMNAGVMICIGLIGLIMGFVAANHIMMIAISTICSGIMTLIVAVYPRKCIVIWSFVDQVFLAVFCILMSCVFVMVVAIEELRKEYKDDIINFHVYTALSFIASVCAIIDCVLYSKLLCCGGKAQDPEEEERIAENRRNSRKIVERSSKSSKKSSRSNKSSKKSEKSPDSGSFGASGSTFESTISARSTVVETEK